MKKLKKILVMLVAVVFSASFLVACTNKDDGNNGGNENVSTEVQTLQKVYDDLTEDGVPNHKGSNIIVEYTKTGSIKSTETAEVSYSEDDGIEKVYVAGDVDQYVEYRKVAGQYIRKIYDLSSKSYEQTIVKEDEYINNLTAVGTAIGYTKNLLDSFKNDFESFNVGVVEYEMIENKTTKTIVFEISYTITNTEVEESATEIKFTIKNGKPSKLENTVIYKDGTYRVYEDTFTFGTEDVVFDVSDYGLKVDAEEEVERMYDEFKQNGGMVNHIASGVQTGTEVQELTSTVKYSRDTNVEKIHYNTTIANTEKYCEITTNATTRTAKEYSASTKTYTSGDVTDENYVLAMSNFYLEVAGYEYFNAYATAKIQITEAKISGLLYSDGLYVFTITGKLNTTRNVEFVLNVKGGRIISMSNVYTAEDGTILSSLKINYTYNTSTVIFDTSEYTEV